MVRTHRSALIAALIVLPLGALPVGAQFGSIFGDPPPRPPANVPSRPPAPNIMQPEPLGPPPSVQPPLSRPGASRPPPSGVEQQPLPAPPGAIAVEPPGEPRQRGAQQPGGIAPPPSDEVVVAPPAQKVVNPVAVFSGLDKITGRIIKFDVEINETVQFGALQVTPRACFTRPPTDSPNTTGFLEVDEVTLQGEVRRIFTGWMFVNSPGLHAVEHPIYDVWLTDCKGGKSAVAETQTPAPAATPAATPPQRPVRPQPPPRPRPQAAPVR